VKQNARHVSAKADVSDDELLAELREALTARAAVPPALVELAENAYAWHHIDAELAQLVYDSRQDTELSASVRSQAPQIASILALTFASAVFSVEVEVAEDALFGQLVPPQPGTVEIQTRLGDTAAAEIDEVGCFSLEPKPDGQFRLRWRTDGQPDVLTGWLTL
jgi:hypothetical protein